MNSKQRKIVFVIGAGASYEVKMPLGDQLKVKIASLLDYSRGDNQKMNGDIDIYRALRNHVNNSTGKKDDLSSYIDAASRIRHGIVTADSIDEFIDSNKSNQKIALVGKLAIVKSILDAERNSTLFLDEESRKNGLDFSLFDKTWYNPFFRLITKHCEESDLIERFKKIGLIIFNYDRCVELFLFNALQNKYGIGNLETTNILKELDVYHPYGSVGELPFQNNQENMGFGEMPSSTELVNLANKIRTYTETTNTESADMYEIKSLMYNPSKIIFLGFAFNPLNLKVLDPAENKKSMAGNKKCFGTAYKRSNSDIEAIADRIQLYYQPGVSVNLKNIECIQLFDEFSHSLLIE